MEGTGNVFKKNIKVDVKLNDDDIHIVLITENELNCDLYLTGGGDLCPCKEYFKKMQIFMATVKLVRFYSELITKNEINYEFYQPKGNS